MGASQGPESGEHPPHPVEQNEEGEAASALMGIVESKGVDEKDEKVGQKRVRDEGLTSKGEERMKKNPPETRVRPSKQFKDLFAPEKLREFRMPTPQDAARCEDIIMIWSDRNEDPAKRIEIKPHLFNYVPSLYTADSELLEGLKGVQTAEEMEEFLRRYCGVTSKPRARARRTGPAAAAAESKVATPLSVETPLVQALPVSAQETVAKAAHAKDVSHDSMLDLLLALKNVAVFVPTALPRLPPVGSLFYLAADLPFNDDGYKYVKEKRRSNDFQGGQCLSVHYSNTSVEVNVQRRSYVFAGCDRALVHYVKLVPFLSRGEVVQVEAPAAAEKPEEAAAEAAVAEAVPMVSEALKDDSAGLMLAKKRMNASIAGQGRSGDRRDRRPGARLLAALGVAVLAPRVRLVPCCAAVNAAFDALEDPEPQAEAALTHASLRHGALTAFNVPFSSLSASHEKNWRMTVDGHPQRDIIYSMVADAMEALVSEGTAKAAAALEAAATDDRMAMARALGVLSNCIEGDNRLMDLVMYIQSGKAPMDWAASTFDIIRDAVCQGDVDKAKGWAEMAVANKPGDRA